MGQERNRTKLPTQTTKTPTINQMVTPGPKIIFTPLSKQSKERAFFQRDMKRGSSASAASAWAWVVVIAAAVMVGEMGREAEAVTCSALQLSPCYAAITSGAAPSDQCCSRLREQKPCLCGYIRNPALRQYVNSPNAKKVASSCGVRTPSC